ncbi:hypothetical protein F4803DRAFT_574030 [Xylaria telfairii]|nr:hypothetical protein F4803DRAFT_574030 [Xylaria telfairii]
MFPQITTGLGQAVPPADHHSITVHMLERYGEDSTTLIAKFEYVYPRMRPHKDIAVMAAAVLRYIGAEEDMSCLLFTSLQSAEECVADRFFAFAFPKNKWATVGGFWSTPGVGASSCFAEANLPLLGELREVNVAQADTARGRFEGPTHRRLRERIVYYLGRDALDSDSQQPSPDDVYFFPTGMAAIYKSHSYMLSLGPGITVLFSIAFVNTLTLFEELSHEYKFFGLRTEDDLTKLESFFQTERNEGRVVRAIWAEFPANPMSHGFT